MRWLIRYWNQNRKQIILTVAIIAFIIIIIQLTNSFLKNREKQRDEYRNRNPYKPTLSVMSGEVVSEEITDKNTEVIDTFVAYCNNKEYEKAFEILSDNCKEVVFNNDINLFINNYCNTNFGTAKTYNLELWMNAGSIYTYRVTYYQNNILATGGGSLNQNTEDYISIVDQNGEDKLNINGFIRKVSMNKSTRKGDVEIRVNSKVVYRNYEVYDITAGNYSQNTVLLSDGQDNKRICLVDNNDVEYPSFIYEIAQEDFILRPEYARNIQIRFDKMYNDRNIEKISFKDIILNYVENQTSPTEVNFETTTIDIKI